MARERIRKYWTGLQESFKHPGRALALTKATRRHYRMEKDFRQRLQSVAPDDMPLEFPHLSLSPSAYFQRNFFSILFLAIYEALGIPRSRQHDYGLALHAVRGIVTATDNILDREDKGALRLVLPGGTVLGNVLSLLLQNDLLRDALERLAPTPDRVALARRALMAAFHDIGRVESAEEAAVETVLSPAELLRTVHAFRGGKLLELAFVVPEALETEGKEALAQARKGVNRIGLALQIFDDVTDFQEDVTRRNHNILRSWLAGPDGSMRDSDISALSEDVLAAPERHFPDVTRQALALGLDFARDGFEMLGRVGFPVDRKAATSLVETLFKLRGLEHLWDFQRAETPSPERNDAKNAVSRSIPL